MKNPFSKIVLQLLVVLLMCAVWMGCMKERPTVPFKVTTKTFYRIAPALPPQPLTINSNSFIGFSFFPGGGTGNATHLGKCFTYFNQLAYSATGTPPPAGSIAAPLADVPQYPVLGGPLPLIQTGDFAQLGQLVTSLNIPKMVDGAVVNTVIGNEKGDAIFLGVITGSSSTFPLSEITIGFKGKAPILGGRGKFAEATGLVDYEGYFNVANPNDAAYNASGWIRY